MLGRALTKHVLSSKFNELKSTSTTPQLSKKPMPVSAVRKGFSDARRKALQSQGVVTIQQVRENQATMKPLR